MVDQGGTGDGDRTVIRRPAPGRGRPSSGGGPPGPPPMPRQPPADGARHGQFTTRGINPLVAAAGSLFALAGQLRESTAHGDVPGLAAHISQEVVAFEAAARAAGEIQETVLPARYALCTLLDEIVLNTPWGSQSMWASETLLVRFHNESFGGDKFFQILDRALQDPGRSLHLLEFLCICLALGLSGRFRLQQDGQRQLQEIADRAFETVRRQRGDSERDLSPHWRGVEDRRPKLARYVPLWVIAAVAAGTLLGTYVAFLYALNSRSDPVVARIVALGREVSAPAELRAPPPPSQVTLARVLADDIQEGLVQVQDFTDRSVVTLWELFPVGDAQLNEQRRPVLGKVADALQGIPGSIVISGHTDSVPIRSLRFPSNWELSERRAETVKRELETVLAPERLRFEGLGDSKPLVPGDDNASRGINRRVEITLFPQGQAL